MREWRDVNFDATDLHESLRKRIPRNDKQANCGLKSKDMDLAPSMITYLFTSQASFLQEWQAIDCIHGECGISIGMTIGGIKEWHGRWGKKFGLVGLG